MNPINNFLTSRMMVGAAVVGLVGAAGVFIYEQVYAEKRRAMLVQEMASLSKQVTSMKQELEALRELQKETQLRRMKQKRRIRREVAASPAGDAADGPVSYMSDSEYFTDYQSVLGTDGELDSEEFYDVHTDDDDDDDDTLKGSVRNGDVSGVSDIDEDKSDKSDKNMPSKTST